MKKLLRHLNSRKDQGQEEELLTAGEKISRPRVSERSSA